MDHDSEIRKVWERDRAYHKRVLKIIPVAFGIVVLLFVTSDRVSLENLEKKIGWKGEMRLLPEITIIPDNDPYNAIESREQLKFLRSFDLDLDEGTNFDEPNLIQDPDPDETDMPEMSYDDLLRVFSQPQRRDTPYSENYIILKMVEPVYPVYELVNGIEGNVTVELFVNDEGFVDTASVISSVGPKSFEESTLEAVNQFVFEPPVQDGARSSMWIRFLIKFRIFN